MEYSDLVERNLNEFQTPLTDKIVTSLPREAYLELLSYVDDVPFVNSLVSKDMRSISQLPRDDSGKIIVDITNPHKLEDMDYFRQSAIHFQKHKRYTDLTPNPHPNSPYVRFWKQEADRCRNGMVREDGEWISGDLYFYWNYCPMIQTKKREGEKRGDRVRDFPKPWLGDYLFFHYKSQAEALGKHVAVIKQRGVGWSYKGGSLGPKRALMYKEYKTFYTAYEKEYLNKDGVLNKAWAYMDFLAQNTPFPRMRLKDSLRSMELKIGYKDLDDGSEKGTLGEIIGVSSKDDPDKLRGKRGTIFFEEFGIFPKVTDVWNVCRDSVEDGSIAFDTMVAGGTGGTEGADFEGAEDMIYNPDTYNIMPLPNVFDKNASGTCIFFWGAYLNRNLCFDENGMPDVIKALAEVLLEFHKIKKSSSDSKALTQRRAEKCITIQDAIMRTEGTLFPVVDLKEHLESIMPRIKEITDAHYIGKLSLDVEGVKWIPDRSKNPIRAFPLKLRKSDSQFNDKEGAIEIFEMPKKNARGKIESMRYIAGIDPVDDDEAPNSVSLPSIIILDLFTDRIVAEYTGRTNRADDFYEVCRRLLIFYNAVANYESNKKGLYPYFSNKNSLYLLADVPEILSDKNFGHSSGSGNKSKGTNANNAINGWARVLVADWLKQTAQNQEYDDEGKQLGEKLNMHNIRSVAILLELIKWNKDINADRVSALGMLMILRQERLKYIDSAKENETVVVGSELANDDYFSI